MPQCRGLKPTGTQLCGGQVAIRTHSGLLQCIKCGRKYNDAEVQIMEKADAYEGELEKQAAEKRKDDAKARAKGKKKVAA